MCGKFSADCTIFYNRGHVGPHNRRNMDAFTHWELESLPSGHWGYIHFPLTQRYARTLGLPCLSHTGKFHTAWGDFHSFKNQAALEYECFRMLAMGAGPFVGDQLPPDGQIEEHVYKLNRECVSTRWRRRKTGASARARLAISP